MNNGQGQLSGTSKDPGQGVSARQPEAPTKTIKELETSQRICKPGLIFLSPGIYAFFITLKVASVRITVRERGPPAPSKLGGKPWAS